MNKTSIEWCDYTINPVKGLCPVGCSYCYARRMYKRFKQDETIRYNPNVMLETGIITKPSRIFVGSTIELFGDWVKPEWLKSIFDWCKTDIGIHTYIFLTKYPENLFQWSPFPNNCWVGVSATNWMQFSIALGTLCAITAKVKFISFEPLLERIQLDMLQRMLFPNLNWIIIGQQTPISAKTSPKMEWIEEIVDVADKAKIPVFLKNNLNQLFVKYDDYGLGLPGFAMSEITGKLRQEFPKA